MKGTDHHPQIAPKKIVEPGRSTNLPAVREIGYQPVMARTLDQGHDMAISVRVGEPSPVRRLRKRPPVAAHDTEEAREFHTVRRVLGLTQVELARELRVSSSTVGLWETGRSRVPYVVRLALRQLLQGILKPL